MDSCDTQQWVARTASCLPESDALIYLIGLCQIQTMNRDTKPSAASRSQTDQTIIAPIIPAEMLLLPNSQAAKGSPNRFAAEGFPSAAASQSYLECPSDA